MDKTVDTHNKIATLWYSKSEEPDGREVIRGGQEHRAGDRRAHNHGVIIYHTMFVSITKQKHVKTLAHNRDLSRYQPATLFTLYFCQSTLMFTWSTSKRSTHISDQTHGTSYQSLTV